MIPLFAVLSAAPSGATGKLDPNRWVDEHGDVMFRYALSRLSRPDVAENAVQEAFVSALKGLDSFSGRSSERTWLMGILKHKIVDHFRKSSRETSTEEPEAPADGLSGLFDTRGRWKVGPGDWGREPEAAFEQTEFWGVFENCLSNLPARHSRAFSLREVDGLDSSEICKVLDITETNLWVMIYRARSKLRRCLESNWFGGEEEPQNA